MNIIQLILTKSRVFSFTTLYRLSVEVPGVSHCAAMGSGMDDLTPGSTDHTNGDVSHTQ